MEVGILDVAVLAEREATMLHKQLHQYNLVASAPVHGFETRLCAYAAIGIGPI